MWSVDATKGDGRRIVVQAEDPTVAFLELETQCRTLPSEGIEQIQQRNFGVGNNVKAKSLSLLILI